MLAVVLVYSGFISVLLAGVYLVSSPGASPISGLGQSISLLAIGLGMSLIGRFLPAPEKHASAPRMQLDELVPTWQFEESHSTRIRASRTRVDQAIREVTAREILFFRALTGLRRFGRSRPESILNAPPDRPLLEVATRSGFVRLADQPGRELVVGMLVLTPLGVQQEQPPTPEQFKNLRDPGFAKAALSFTIDEETPEVCRVTTETRVYATDAPTRRQFAAYWRIIYPGSSLIRHMWLRAIRRRAEA